MREAVAAYASRAGEKLRAEGLQACHMAVFLQTNPHRPDEAWHGCVKNLGRYAASWIAGWPNRPSSTAALT